MLCVRAINTVLTHFFLMVCVNVNKEPLLAQVSQAEQAFLVVGYFDFLAVGSGNLLLGLLGQEVGIQNLCEVKGINPLEVARVDTHLEEAAGFCQT